MLKKLLDFANKRKNSRCAAVIVAAGQSSRMKGEDKILAELLGKPVIERSIEAFQLGKVQVSGCLFLMSKTRCPYRC